MSSIVISGDTSGAITVSAPAVSGTNTATLPAATGELSMLGATGQAYSDLAASRVLGTTYTNSTGKPIFVSWAGTNSSANGVAFGQVGGVTVARSGGAPSASAAIAFTFIVPTSATYAVVQGTGTSTTTTWFELR
jgi:hypothetical protein